MIVFSNEERIPVTLDTGDPNRPAVFYFRPLTFGEFRRFANLKNELDAAQDIDGKIKVIGQALTGAMVDWSITDTDGNAVPFDPSTILDFLPQNRVKELMQAIATSQQVSGGDRGK